MSSTQDSPGIRAKPIPYGLMSLWDMISCGLPSLFNLCSQLNLYRLMFRDMPQSVDSPTDVAPDAVLYDVRGWLSVASGVATNFELPAVQGRIALVEKRLSKGRVRYVDIATEMRVLLETIEDGIKHELIYRYPRAKADVLSRWKSDWTPVLQSFPAAADDILAGVDLWALGHSTASVFQFMRVLEHGLRVLASDVGKTFDTQTWQGIIGEIESEISRLAKQLPRGVPKNERLQFLSEAAKEFYYFKDGWRNYVSHNKCHYDEHQARSVMEHVKGFMMTLSLRLREV